MVRWLHLSDVHETTREGYARGRMYEHIVDEVGRRQDTPPDMVFLTGDLAYAGTEAEYEALERTFIDPLKAVLPAGCPLFAVPGNHDADRKRGTKPRLWCSDPDERRLFQAVGVDGAAKRRDTLMPRFSAYAAFDQRVSAWGRNWLDTDEGAVWNVFPVRGKKVAVVGVNTAWLAQDDADWGRLTPGRDMLENALRHVQREQPDLLIVLGHHPLEAFFGEEEGSDGARVRERLQQANALYLHGHLHTSGSQRIGDSLRNSLAVQAPSAFQAHDDRTWRNGLMWGGADVDRRSLFLEPMLWSPDRSEYKLDLEAGYNADLIDDRSAFRIPLPGSEPPAPALPAVPQGWRMLDRAEMQRIRGESPDAEAVAGYFDGRFPTLELVSARGVQARQIVDRLAGALRGAYTGAPQPLVTLLSGPGGEGKSTALLHTAIRLVEDDRQSWTCLHREVAAAPLPESLFADLPVKAGHAWLVAIDDADNVAMDILAAVKRLGARNDVHLLLAARDADWKAKRGVPGLLRQAATFSEVQLDRLDGEDARRIAAGWHAWGDGGMGKLRGLSQDEAAEKLLAHARDLAARPDEGALLGALLVTRQGEDMREHVWRLLQGLSGAPAIGTVSVRDIYAMIAAMHAENQLYLTPSVLAYALRCDVAELETQALDTLRREAMLDPGDAFLLTRHRRIAEAACTLLREDGEDVDRWYPFLAKAALKDFRENRTGDPHINDWCTKLARHFVDKGERWWPVARAVAYALWQADPDDGHRVTALSVVFRKTRKPKDALQLLKGTGERFRSDRGVLYEWGTLAGAAGDHGLDVWLTGRSLADGNPVLDTRQMKLSLAGLGAAFAKLSEALGDSVFNKARSACGQLGLRLPDIDATARGYFEKYIDESGIGELSPADAVSAIRAAVVLGAAEMEPENEPVFYETLLGDPEGYRYTTLLRAVSGTPKSQADRRVQSMPSRR